MSLLGAFEKLLGRKDQPQQSRQPLPQKGQSLSTAQPQVQNQIRNIARPQFDGINPQTTNDPFGVNNPMRNQYVNINPVDEDTMLYGNQVQPQFRIASPYDLDMPAQQNLGVNRLQRTIDTDRFLW